MNALTPILPTSKALALLEPILPTYPADAVYLLSSNGTAKLSYPDVDAFVVIDPLPTTIGDTSLCGTSWDSDIQVEIFAKSYAILAGNDYKTGVIEDVINTLTDHDFVSYSARSKPKYDHYYGMILTLGYKGD